VEESGYAQGKIVDAIQSAREIVCVSSFLFSNDAIKQALLSAAKRSVRCYLLTMSEEHLAKDPEEEKEKVQQRINEHKQTLDTLAGHVLIRTAQGLHTKLVVIDPSIPNRAKGFLSTANLTNEALIKNTELVIQLERDRASALFEQFRCGFWQESEHEVLEAHGKDGHCRVEDIGPAGRRKVQTNLHEELPLTIGTINTLKMALNELLDWAKDEIWFSAYKFDTEHETGKKLIETIKSGVKTRIFVSSRRATAESAIIFQKSGAEVYSSVPLLHAKALLVRTGNELRGLIMTANIEALGLDIGYETGVLLTEPECKTLQDIISRWAGSFEYRFVTEYPRGKVRGDCLIWNGKELTKATVGGTAEITLNPITAKDLRSIESTESPAFSDPANPAFIPHEAVYSWKVDPPILPKGARKIEMPVPKWDGAQQIAPMVEKMLSGSYPVYELKGKKYIVVNTPDMLEKAAKQAVEENAILVVE
jgi:cardiolipin synthase